ncbi:MAG: lamin tail domain-containing protein [Clostridia bacterium]|nr:lamin tail domain-containing protein [Clostridia bacterium]
MPQTVERTQTKKRRGHKADIRIPAVIFFLAFIVFAVIVAPKAPIQQAFNADGTGGGAYTGLVISEVMASNSSALPDDNGSFSDWVEIANRSDKPIDLEGVTLSDRSDKAIFLFPAHILQPGEKLIVFCDGVNQNTLNNGAYHAKFKLSSIGESVFIFNPTGYVIDSVDFPTLNMNEVYARNEDGTFSLTDQYSPGYENSEEGHVEYLSAHTIEASALRINEIMAAPRSGLRDENGELQDWIELYNASDKRIYLNNYALSDNADNLLKWFFPKDAYIEPGQYYIVFCSGLDLDGAETGYPHTNFGLAAEGETVTLSNSLGQLVDRVKYETLSVDCSYGRDDKTNTWKEYTLATPGAANDDKGIARADEYLRALNNSKVYISEVMSSNDRVSAIAGEEYTDWVEIYNAGTEAVDLSGWGLSDNINWPRKWQFPQGLNIWPGEYKIVLLDGSASPGTDSSHVHSSIKLTREGGETLTLSDSTGYVLDKLYLPEIPTDYSYGRTWGLSGFFYYDGPTPGADNTVGFKGFAATPAFVTKGGLYGSDVTVEIDVPIGTTVRYTLDGSTPTLANSTEYTGPFVIQDTKAVRARAFEGDLQPSPVISATYVLKTYYTMPVVCLVTDPDGLWNGQTGIFSVGDGNDILQYTGIPFRNPTPLYRIQKENGVRVDAYGEMFDNETGEVIFSQGLEFGLIGQYSLDMPQKSLKVVAKARYGSKYIEGKLFEDRDFTQYRAFVLRNSGNDCVWTRMVDGVQSRLADKTGTTVIHQAWRPVIVYLNGRYWGHYNLRERVGEHFVAQHEGLSLEAAETITVLEGNGTASSQVNNGSNAEWKTFIAKVKTLSPGKNKADLQYILDNVDVDNYFDYVIFESYFANTDSGNIRFYKVPGDKWKWIMYDMDYGLFSSTSNGISNYLNPKGHGANDDISNVLILKLLENKEMFNRFMTRFGEIFRLLNTDTMIREINACYAILEPEMDMHFGRWAESNLKSIAADQPQSKDGSLRYWNTRVERLRNVARKRPAYCWRQVAEWFKLSDKEMESYFGPIPLIGQDATWDSEKQKDQAMTYLYGKNWQKLYK